ncbi:NADH dehydrogenase [Coprinopsis sp. MPI-PUGE-AT-0042]|nr:NADH dehydrogenase [Coprinopsis sp. MPI-PUGE-AT-0042]
MASSKVVLCGAGFLGKHIARSIATNTSIPRHVQLSSRNPAPLLKTLSKELPPERISAVPVDITRPATLAPAFEGAHTVVSMVGLLQGTPSQFEAIQVTGAREVALAARNAGARLIHISAIGADSASDLPYAKTKGQGEELVMDICPDATIIRPSLVFGPEDDFFNRFATLSRFLPVLPVFNGGTSKFQPVFVDDIADLVEVTTRGDHEVERRVSGAIVEAGGPEVFTFRELMHLVLEYTNRYRAIVSLPMFLGMIQATVMEKLPTNVFTITRDQIKQLQLDNIVNPNLRENDVKFEDLLVRYLERRPTSMHKIVPTYLRP